MLKSRSLMVVFSIVILGQSLSSVTSFQDALVLSTLRYMYGCSGCGPADKSMSLLDIININLNYKY